MKNKRKKKTEPQKFLSSNDQYIICKNDGSDVLELYAQNPETSLYDLAETIYNDCITQLNIPTPIVCNVIFYHSRAYVRYFRLKSCQSIEDTLKEISKKIRL